MPMNPRLLVPRASGFNPRRIAGLTGWWDAADASTVTLDGGRVATWADKSGLGRNATNSTSGSTQPNYSTGAVNGRNALAFVAADSTVLTLSNIAIPASHTVFGVLTRPSANTVSTLLSNEIPGTERRTSLLWFTDNVVYVASNDGFTSHGTITATGTFVFVIRRTGTTSVLVRRNGTASNVTTGTGITGGVSGNWSRIGRGASGFMTGSTCEIILYPRSLSDGELTAVENYLAAKWGVTL